MVRMGSVGAALATAMAMIAIFWSGLHGAQAQGTVTCRTEAGDGAPYNDANELVQFLREDTENALCTIGPCTSYPWKQWNAIPTICAPNNTCVTYNVVGNYLNEVLAQCNQQNNEVDGLYTLNPEQSFYLTAKTCIPNCVHTR